MVNDANTIERLESPSTTYQTDTPLIIVLTSGNAIALN